MKSSPIYGPTDGLFTGMAELVRVDPNFLNGQPIVAKAGDRIPFEVASFQAVAPLVAVRWVPADYLKVKPSADLTQGKSWTITLRDMSGTFIVEDLPITRLSEGPSASKFASLRNLVFEPVFIDWRRSYVRNLTGALDPLTFMFTFFPANR